MIGKTIRAPARDQGHSRHDREGSVPRLSLGTKLGSLLFKTGTKVRRDHRKERRKDRRGISGARLVRGPEPAPDEASNVADIRLVGLAAVHAHAFEQGKAQQRR